MNFEQSFPVFDLNLDCQFQSSDSKYQLLRKQNLSNTFNIEDANIHALTTIGKRNSNLDTFSYLRKGSSILLGIFDGHGDDQVAKYLEKNMLKRISEHQLYEKNLQLTLKIVFKQIEEQVVQMFQKGSTALVVIVKENQIIAANVGDSKLFGLTKQDGKLESLTKQHDLSNQSQVANIMSKGGLIFKRANQYRINGQLNISRSIGDRKHKNYMSAQPQIYKIDKSNYKKLILATDGFYKHELFGSQLCKRSLKQIQNKIKKGILGYGFDDNATVLCLKIKSFSPNASSQEFYQPKNIFQ